MTVGARTLAEAARHGARQLEAAGLSPDEAAIDASLLARACLGWDAAEWLVHRNAPAAADFQAMFETAIGRRARREPVAYVLGEREFYGRPFFVTPAVLVPRPETELIIEEAKQRLPTLARAADVGTGSGCLAVTLAAEWPEARIVATDVSRPALAVAGRNAERHGVSGRIVFQEQSLLAPGSGPFDLVVSNPPYVAERDREALPPEVGEHEPALALFGGADGLAVIRALLPLAAAALRPGGLLLMEIGRGQADAVSALVQTSGLALQDIRPDLAGIPRVVIGVRS